MKAQTSGSVRLAQTAEEIRYCYPVMQQLRTHLTPERYEELVTRMQKNEGYQLAYVDSDRSVAAVAGFRYMEMLYTDGRIMYVDDLVTDPQQRSHGHGHTLMQWLEAEARRNGCVELHLDSGVQRFDATPGGGETRPLASEFERSMPDVFAVVHTIE
jgi:GNAT superfamily N-acetyltransferase